MKKKSVRVLVVIPELGMGGAEQHVSNVFPKLPKQLFQISILALRPGGVLEPILRADGISVMALPQQSRGPLAIIRLVWQLRLVMRAFKPDFVHFFLPEAYLLGLPASIGISTRRIMSRRSLSEYQKRRRGVRVVEKIFHRGVDLALANSRMVAEELVFEGVRSDRIGLLSSGVDERFLAGSESRLESRPKPEKQGIVFVCVANLWPYKGHLDLVEALASIRARISPDWSLLLIGRDEGVLAPLLARAESLNISSNIRFVGPVDDVLPYLAESDIFVLPSHEEGLSNALLEAMMAGLPIVTTAVGGNLDAIRDGVDGLLVPARDPERLGGALLNLTANAELRKVLARNAQARARKHFSLQACVDKYADLYVGLIEGRYPPLPPSMRPESAGALCAE